MDLHTGSTTDEDCNPVVDAPISFPRFNPLEFNDAGPFEGQPPYVEKFSDIKAFIEGSGKLRVCSNSPDEGDFLSLNLKTKTGGDGDDHHDPTHYISSLHGQFIVIEGRFSIFAAPECIYTHTEEYNFEMTFDHRSGQVSGGSKTLSVDSNTVTMDIGSDGFGTLSGPGVTEGTHGTILRISIGDKNFTQFTGINISSFWFGEVTLGPCIGTQLFRQAHLTLGGSGTYPDT